MPMSYVIPAAGLIALAAAVCARSPESRHYALAAVVCAVVLEVVCWGPR